MRRFVDLSSISYNSIVPVPVREARSGIFDHKFTVQTFKYLLACFIPSSKVLLHIILYIPWHAYVCRLKAAFHTILLILYLCVYLEANFRPTIYVPNIKILACMFHSTEKSPVAYYFIYIHLHAYVCRLKAAFNTILLSLYLCVKLEAEFSTINLQSKHSNASLHVSFHP